MIGEKINLDTRKTVSSNEK